MRIVPITSSSNVTGIAFDPEEPTAFYIEFKGDQVYRYEHHDEHDVRRQLLSILFAPSVGKAVNEFKQHNYPYRELEPEEVDELDLTV